MKNLRHSTLALLCTFQLLTVINAQNVGIETISPDSTLSIKNKLEIGGAQGDIVFTDDEGSITFPSSTAPNSAMINMFSSGTSNADRMVLSHSPGYQNWGLQYSDTDDVFHFLGNGDKAFSIDLFGKRAALGSGASLNSLFTLNVQSSTEDRTGYFYNSKVSTSNTFGIYAGAFGTGAGDKRGGSFDANGGTGENIGVKAFAGNGSTNIGIYASASGGATNWAAHFNGGDVIVSDRVGIGTEAPTTKLQILGGSDVSLTGLGYFQLGSTTGANLVFDENEIEARNNGAEAILYVQRDAGDLSLCGLKNGAVGIGKVSGFPLGYLLSVDGKIISEELRIRNSSNWPDYVFNEEYKLMPLDELEIAIKTQKHLPNIPSAEVVENEGLLVGEMQKRMIEKIEELTLYVIEINKQNQTLNKEVQILKKELKSLQLN